MSTKMLQNLVLTFLCFTFLPFIECIEFCHSFKENDYKISYGFTKVDPSYRGSDLYLFIGQHYWQLSLSEGQLQFISTQSKESDWFTPQYSLAFELMFNDTLPFIGLLNNFKDLIEFRIKTQNNEDLIGFDVGKDRVTVTPINFEGDLKPTLVIQLYKWIRSEGWVAFVQQNESQFHWNFAEFDKNLSLKSLSSGERSDIKELEVLKKAMNTNEKILTVFVMPSEDFIVLFKDGTSIVWCAVLNSNTNNSLITNCEKDGREVLIDCYNNIVNILLITLIVIVLILFIPVICWTLYQKYSTRDIRRRHESTGTVLESAIGDNKQSKVNRLPTNISLDSNKPFVDRNEKKAAKSDPKLIHNNQKLKAKETIDSKKPFEEKPEKKSVPKVEPKPVKNDHKSKEAMKPKSNQSSTVRQNEVKGKQSPAVIAAKSNRS